MKKTYYLSLGSNLGNKITNLHRAVMFIKGMGHLKSISSVYQTSPVDMDAGTENFLNLALSVESTLDPVDMLRRINVFESQMGRTESISGYVSRIIDIDILMVNGDIISQPSLTIPHPKMTERAFVLVPLSEIASELIHPILKKKVVDILEEIETTETVDRYSEKLFD